MLQHVTVRRVPSRQKENMIASSMVFPVDRQCTHSASKISPTKPDQPAKQFTQSIFIHVPQSPNKDREQKAGPKWCMLRSQRVSERGPGKYIIEKGTLDSTPMIADDQITIRIEEQDKKLLVIPQGAVAENHSMSTST